MPKRKAAVKPRQRRNSKLKKIETKFGKQSTSEIALEAPDLKICNRLPNSFYNQSCADLAKSLLGKALYCTHNGLTSGIIVETEAYLGVEDRAAHSYNNKRTEKTEAMFMPAGTAYVYHIYGMYCCMNVSSKGDGCAVLIRALQPHEGIDDMRARRSEKKKAGSNKLKDKEISNGPSKLTQALNITKANTNKLDLPTSDSVWLADIGTNVEEKDIVTCKRINIDYAEDWINKPLRFYLMRNPNVSVRNKEAENLLKE